jgi:hypothetical protein
VTSPTLSIVQNFISIGQGVTAGRGPKIACSHRKAESSIILHCTTVHAVICSWLHNRYGGLQLGGWVASECICRFYAVFRLHFRRSIRLQMRFDAWCIIQANRRHGNMGLLYWANSESCICAFRSTFCSWSCNRPNHELYYFMWGYKITFEKVGRNSEGVWNSKQLLIVLTLLTFFVTSRALNNGL